LTKLENVLFIIGATGIPPKINGALNNELVFINDLLFIVLILKTHMKRDILDSKVLE